MTILKLKRCRISGFKALHGASLRIRDDLTILIGNNGAGKSSIIQALGFVREFINGAPDKFFDSRGWSKRDVKSQINGAPNAILIDLSLEMPDGCRLLWQITWGLLSGTTLREVIWLCETHRAGSSHTSRVLSYRNHVVSSDLDEDLNIRGLTLKGSMLSVIDAPKDSRTGRVLTALAEWGAGITSLELLNPGSMREGLRGKAATIGSRGEYLASFLSSLTAGHKARIVERLSEFYPLRDIDTTRKRSGWVDLRISETFGIGEVGPLQISDGFLRLLALCAIPELGNATSLVLLDEIEDGIEPHILPDLIRRVVDDAPFQFVMTSHSPLLVNFFDPEQVTIIGRRGDGSALSASLADLPSVSRGLEYFGVGEMWVNMGSEALERELADAVEGAQSPPLPRFSPSYVRAFISEPTASDR